MTEGTLQIKTEIVREAIILSSMNVKFRAAESSQTVMSSQCCMCEVGVLYV